MPRSARLLAAVLAAAAVLAPFAGDAVASSPDAEAFRPETVTDGVVLFHPVDPGPHGLTRTNALVVRRDDGLLVVGAQPSLAAARELLASIGSLWPDPVRYLVLTHPTAAETGGASAFPDETLRIASEGFATTLAAPDFDWGAELRAVSHAPAAWVGPPAPVPDLALRGTAILEDPRHPVEIQIAPPAYAPGGLTVELPRDDVLWLGPLLFAPGSVPHADRAYLDAWMAMLNRALKRRIEYALPRRGERLTRAEIERSRDALAWLRGQVESAFVHRVPLDTVQERVLGAEDRSRHFRIDDVNRPRFEVLVDRAIGDATRERKKRGLPVPE